jgi:hypothetical protein
MCAATHMISESLRLRGLSKGRRRIHKRNTPQSLFEINPATLIADLLRIELTIVA